MQKDEFCRKTKSFLGEFLRNGDVEYDRIEIVLVRKGSEKEGPAYL